MNCGQYELVAKENGTGLKKEVNFDASTSLGLELIKGLSHQIFGEAAYKFESGSVFTILFKDFEARITKINSHDTD